MANRYLKVICMAALLTIIVLPVFSYSKADAAGEDKKIFQKFFQVTGAEAQYNQMLNLMVRQFQQGFASGLQRQAARVENAAQADKDRVIQLLQQAMFAYIEKIKAAMVTEMPFQDLVDNVYYPIYSKYFHASDIQEIIKFYESPIGQKFVSMSPILMQESVQGFNQQYGPKLRELSSRIADEEFAKIRPEIDKLDKKSN